MTVQPDSASFRIVSVRSNVMTLPVGVRPAIVTLNSDRSGHDKGGGRAHIKSTFVSQFEEDSSKLFEY